MKNIKIGTKLIGGFLIVSLIVLIVGFFGWNGARQLQVHIDDLGNMALPAVGSLQKMKTEGNAVRIALRTIFNPRISEADKLRQYENIQAARDRHNAAWAIYEGVQKDAEEEQLFKELIPAWNAWNAVNDNIIEMAKEIDATDIRNPDDLHGRIVGFIGDHHVLMEKTLLLIITGQEFEGGGDPAVCNFGKWLASYQTSNPKINKLLKDVRDYHDPFHESVVNIKNLMKARNQNDALVEFNANMQPDAQKVFGIFNELEVEVERVVDLYDEMMALGFGDAVAKQNAAIEILDKILNFNTDEAAEATLIAESDGVRVQTVALIGMVAGVIFAFVIGIILTRSITSPLSKGVKFAQEIAMGDLQIKLDIYQKDELGILAEALRDMLKSLQYKADKIESIARKDLTIDVQKSSEKDGLGASLILMKDSLNEILTQVNIAVDQVSTGSDQVSQASQSLSQGATEQASSLEEISSSTNEVNGQSRQNAENATEANAIARKAAEDAAKGNEQMKNLMVAMDGINKSSEEIKKVVKVIDDIAFQINLLALNANVEAARAGKYGKGFAVVAEEVRNLAVRSADAVKETTGMVEESIRNIEMGTRSANETAKQLEDIVIGASKVADFLGEIALASKEQAQAIEQITGGLDQIDQVTQANTASAEESASASEELASQAQQLKAMISQFKLEGMETRMLTSTAGKRAHTREEIMASMDTRTKKPELKRATAGKPVLPIRDKQKTQPPPQSRKEQTGIKAVDPSEIIKLDDDDFETF